MLVVCFHGCNQTAKKGFGPTLITILQRARFDLQFIIVKCHFEHGIASVGLAEITLPFDDLLLPPGSLNLPNSYSLICDCANPLIGLFIIAVAQVPDGL